MGRASGLFGIVVHFNRGITAMMTWEDLYVALGKLTPEQRKFTANITCNSDAQELHVKEFVWDGMAFTKQFTDVKLFTMIAE